MNQDAISAYIRLAAHRPELFAPSKSEAKRS